MRVIVKLFALHSVIHCAFAHLSRYIKNQTCFRKEIPMNSNDHPEIPRLLERLADGMISYMHRDSANPAFDAGYTQAHIDQCRLILDAFLISLFQVREANPRATILNIVKCAILKLNSLNAQCNGRLIETDQRELLCDIILHAASDAGLKTDDDITEEWREW